MASLRTPLFAWHVAHGGRMIEFGGWEMPVQYAGIVAEHQAVRSAAGLFDISHMGRLAFEGAEVAPLLQAVWTNDAASMKDTQVRYGLIANEQGGILDDVLVYRWPNAWSMVVNASNRLKIVAHLERHAAGRDARVVDQTLTTAMLAIQGPKALALARDLFEADIAALKYYFALATRCQGHDCVVSRTGYTGEDGIEIILDPHHAVALADEIVRRGAVPCGLGARDTLRLEAAMPLYGHELTESIDPYQAGLAWAVKPDKGEFVGRSAMLASRDRPGGPERQRVGLVLAGRRAAREGCAVLSAAGAPVGTVTSGSFTPTVNQSIAMAYVALEHAAVGTALNVEIRGKVEPAVVAALPFYKRPKP